MAAGFLALGDSYTIGEGVAPADRWPAQMAARLRESGTSVADPTIVATTGWTTGELAAALDAATLAPPYALVTLLIGVNNQYRGLPLVAYRNEFRALLTRAVAWAGAVASRVVVVSIPDWGVTPFAAQSGRDRAAVAREIDAFNAAAQAATIAAGAQWVDITAVSRSPAAADECAADGLHPSAAQYARWAEAILPIARAALEAHQENFGAARHPGAGRDPF
ncbi:MAG TPA: GDSL-type esterase/lipase family protein [Rhodanobacteraceae bacterium]